MHAQTTVRPALPKRLLALFASAALVASLVPSVALTALSETAWAEDTVVLSGASSGSGSANDPYQYGYTGSRLDLSSSYAFSSASGVTVVAAFWVSDQVDSATSGSSFSSSTGPVDVGSYTFCLCYLSGSSYAYAYVYFDIVAITLSSVTATDASYTGSAVSPTLSFTTSSSSSSSSSLSFQSNDVVISYYATSTTDTSSSISVTDADDSTTYYATGSALTSVTDAGTWIVAISAGTSGNISISGDAIYCLLTVEPASISSAFVSLPEGTWCIGNISSFDPTVTLTLNDSTVTLTKDTDYTLTFTDSSTSATTDSITAAGTYAVTVTGTGNFDGTVTSSSTVTVTGHSLTHTDATEATCEVDGNSAYVYCSICEQYWEADSTSTTSSPVASSESEAYESADEFTISKLDHDYSATPSETSYYTWTWTNNYQQATLTLICKRDSTHTYDAGTVTTTSTVTTAATYTSTGVRTYTASLTYNDQTFTDTKTETIARLIQSANTMTAKGKKVTVKGKTKNKKVSKTTKLAVTKVLTVKNAKGTVTYKKVGKKGGKLIAVNAATGKVTLKKGLKAGTYKFKIKVTAAGNADYTALKKNVAVTIIVK